MATEDDSSALSHLYRSQFVPESYVSQYYSDLDQEEKFFLSHLHRFFETLGNDKGKQQLINFYYNFPPQRLDPEWW